jgi:hypothetical protein
MSVKIQSPYFDSDTWLKAGMTIHGRSSECDSKLKTEVMVREYVKAGYQALVIAESGKTHIVESGREQEYILVMPAYEKICSSHMIILGEYEQDEFELDTINDKQKFIDRQNKKGALVLLSHPHYKTRDHWSVEHMKELDGYVGIEILNGEMRFDRESIENSGGSCDIATDMWDELLSSGKKVWGFGSDGECHWRSFNTVFNLVNTERKTDINNPGRICGAIRNGSFAVSTGVRIKNIFAADGTIQLIVDNPFENKVFIAYGRNKKVLKVSYTAEEVFTYTPKGDEGYVRMQVLYESGKTLFTQPFFIN